MNVTENKICANTMLNMPKLSVITVVWNDRDGFQKTVSSIASQNYPDLEYIVIDGESTDGTVDVIRKNEPCISRWISEPDKGLYDAMNKAKALAKGDWALFLNAGDTFPTTDTLRRVMTPVPARNVIIFGNVLLSYGNLAWQRPPRKNNKAILFNGYIPHHQTILYPRCFFKNEDYDIQFRVVADADYTTRAIKKYTREHRDVDLVSSTLGGFTFTMYRECKGAMKMYRERLQYSKKNNPSFSPLHAARLALLVFIKYLSVRIGGVPLATRIMYWKLKIGTGSFR